MDAANALAALVSKGNPASPFVDTYRVLHPDETVVGTFTGFEIGNTAGEKITTDSCSRPGGDQR